MNNLLSQYRHILYLIKLLKEKYIINKVLRMILIYYYLKDKLKLYTKPLM